jgi:rubrerythrin
MEAPELRDLASALRRAHAGELAAFLAYQGHARSVEGAESGEIAAIATQEMEHRRSVARMLEDLGAKPGRLREALFRVIGAVLGSLCRVSGWLLPMYGAGLLESGNIREYEEAAGLALAGGRPDLVPDLLRMAQVEWDHESYFRAKVLSRPLRVLSLWSLEPLWPAPPPRETIRPRLPGKFSRRARSRGQRRLEADPMGPLSRAAWRGRER